ncbi:MAG: bifunctional acetate--CoA ligase family protein/GNAT family N-acetyltransferase [Usitatibacter sp.]
MSSRHYLAPLFEPRSIALVGATEIESKVAGLVLENLLGAGFGGPLYAVNPKYSSVRGVPCFASLEQLPERVDLAVVATPAPTVPAIIESCGRAGIPAAVIITAGFSEAGAEGAALERALLDSAHRHGVRILGPNCVGLMRPPMGLNATFARGPALAGSLALVSQSGAVCTAMLDWATPNGIGFSSVVSLGGSTDLDFGEVIDYLATDPMTEHILLYIEGVRDGRRLVSSLRAASRTKPVILMKVGRHPAASRAAVSHTGAIVGNDDVFDAVVRRTGVVRVATMNQLVGAAQALASHVHPRGNRLAVITNGGGPGVMAADRAGDLGIMLPRLAPETTERLGRALPANWSHGNPVDLIGDAGPERYREAVAACLADGNVDGVIAILTPQAMTNAEGAARAVIEASQGRQKPVLACWMGEASVEPAREALRKAGLAVFDGPEPAVVTFAHLADFDRNQRALLEVPGPLAQAQPSDLERARALVRLALPRGLMSGAESKELLAAFRIPVALSVRCKTAEEAVRAAGSLGYPVAMKIDSPDVTHKSDVGGVVLGLLDEAAVNASFGAMLKTVASKRPGARIDGVTLESMQVRPNGRELMVGVVRDAIFGPAITFGAGGTAVEILRDRTVALPPLNAILTRDMIRGTRVARMLGEFRNLPAVHSDAIDAVLMRVSEMACEIPEIEENDINPLVADENGAVALDARVVLRERAAPRSRYAHLSIHPYPADLATQERLAGGTSATLRPIRPEDAELEKEFIAGLSPETMHLRFLSALRTLTPQMLARFTQVDYDRDMAFVALIEVAGREREIGVCRYATLPDAESCEYAIVVADEWQGKGLGRIMMRRLIEVAQARGLKSMVGFVLASNEPMLRLCAELGFVAAIDAEDPMVRHVTLALPAKAPTVSRDETPLAAASPA